MADAFESILVAWLAFVFLPEKPTRSQGGTDGSNPLSSCGEPDEMNTAVGQAPCFSKPSVSRGERTHPAPGGESRRNSPNRRLKFNVHLRTNRRWQSRLPTRAVQGRPKLYMSWTVPGWVHRFRTPIKPETFTGLTKRPPCAKERT